MRLLANNKFIRTLILLSLRIAAGPSSPPPASGKNEGPSGAAIVTLVCAVVSWLFLPMIAAIVGIIIGRGELKKIERGESPQAGELIAKIGYFACIANLVVTIVGGCLSIGVVIAIWGGLLAGAGGLAIFSELANSLPQ